MIADSPRQRILIELLEQPDGLQPDELYGAIEYQGEVARFGALIRNLKRNGLIFESGGRWFHGKYRNGVPRSEKNSHATKIQVLERLEGLLEPSIAQVLREIREEISVGR